MSRLACLSLAFSLSLAGCLPDSNQATSPETGSSGLSVRVSPLLHPDLAARAQSAEPGGKLTVEVTNASRNLQVRDSLVWSGTSDGELRFPSLSEGPGYVVRAWYRDPSGYTTHGDSIGGVRIARGEESTTRLALRALLGKILLNAPSIPVGVDTLAMTWTLNGSIHVAKAGRGTGGRTILRLDSLAIGKAGKLSLRAWNASGDTLFHLDSTLVLASDKDLPLALNLVSSRGSILAGVEVLPGGEIDATASFAGEADQPQSQDGRLLLVAFADSGAADWIGILNPGPAFSGTVRLGKGSTDALFALELPTGATAVATRASCEAVASASHPLHGVEHLVCGLSDVVVTHSTAGGSYWRLRSGDASVLHDAVLVLDAKQSWPDLNTSNLRTARLRAGWKDAMSNDAGIAWCADGSDSATTDCP